MPSRAEGGANVVSEALVRGLPILATRVPGNVGLLGAGYPGLFPQGNARALGRLLTRLATDPRARALVRQASRRLARFHAPAAEVAAWKALLEDIT